MGEGEHTSACVYLCCCSAEEVEGRVLWSGISCERHHGGGHVGPVGGDEGGAAGGREEHVPI